jgi:hypothetical protein
LALIHFPAVKSFFCCKPFLWVLLPVIWLLTPVLRVDAQSVVADMTSVGAPSGSLTAPFFVIDSDADNPDPAYNRHFVPGSAQVSFSRAGGVSSGSETFRVIASLIDSTGNPVTLVGGVTSVVSATQSISLSASTPTATRTFSVEMHPAGDLGAGVSLKIRYSVQRYNLLGIGPGGVPLFTWVTADGPDESTSFIVTHFRDRGVPAENANARGWLRAAAAFDKTFAVSRGTGLEQSFSVTVPYTLSRYDIGGTSQGISLRFTAEMTDDLGNGVPLVNGGQTTVSFSRNAFLAGTPNVPHTVGGTRTVLFTPVGQLDPANRTYRVAVRFEHVEVAPSTFRNNGTSVPSPAQRLLHFNGNLAFGGIATVFSRINNTPTVGSLGVNLVNTTLNPGAGSVPSHPNYGFAEGADLPVRLLSSGNAVVTEAGSRTVSVLGGGQVSGLFGNVRVRYFDTRLTSTGAVAGSAVIDLPQGLSYTPNRATSAGRFLAELGASGPLALNTQFRHSGIIAGALPSNAWVFDEARTLLYQVSSFAFLQNGGLDFDPADCEWVHKPAFDQLENQRLLGQHEREDMRDRLTNEGYLQRARPGARNALSFGQHSDGSIRTLEAEVEVAAGGRFVTHSPQGTVVNLGDTGLIKIRNGQVSDDSELNGVKLLRVSFDGSCEGSACGPAPGSAVDLVEVRPAQGKLRLTSDGGLRAVGEIVSKAIEWGIRGDFSPTHRTDVMHEGSFHASGNQLYAAEHPLSVTGPMMASAPLLAPGSLLLAGYDPNNHESPVYPQTPRYRDGVGSYPGATLVSDDKGAVGASRLAGMTGEYPYLLMAGASKYYVRRSGVSGRHVAVEQSLQPGLVMYDYPFRLRRYQLTFLSNSNEDSWIDGSVEVPKPAGFEQSFVGLRLGCTGALEGAGIDPNDRGAKPLAYWKGSFEPLSLRFAPVVGADCDSDRFLTIGLLSGAANIDQPVAGSLAFRPSGHIATLGDAIEGVDCRLGLPARLEISGPGRESYQLVPASKLYFNNAEAPNAPASGFVNFAASCNVPFFEDLKVHVMTSAQAGTGAPLYLAGGWKDGADSHFTNRHFDGNHLGLPPGSSVVNYQSPNDETPYVVRARQSLFGLVPLDYPLRWNPTARYFQSWPAEPTSLVVLTVRHQVNYLSAENVEISFGTQYEGLPKINLASAAAEVVDGQLGAARALTQAAQSYVTDTLNRGIEDVGNLVNDTMESVLDDAIEAIDAEVITPLHQAVVMSYQQAVAADQTYGNWVHTTSGGLKTEFDRYLDGSVGVTANSVKGRLRQLSAASNDAASLIKRVNLAVDRGILAIDSITGEIRTYRRGSEVVVSLSLPSGFSPDAVINGLLREIEGPGGSVERQIVQSLVRSLIRDLAPPDLAAALNPALDDLSSDLNKELKTLLEQFDPTLDRITEVLLEARGYLVGVRARLAAGGNLLTSFQQIINNATAEIDAIVAGMRTLAYDFIERIARAATVQPSTALRSVGSLIDEFNKDEFVGLLRAELRDRLLASQFIRQIQYTLRQTLSEFDIALRSAVDSAFNEVNRMCRELIKSGLGPLDETIHGLVGNLGAYVGAGSVDGYAHIQGDTLRRLRLDAMVQLKVPDEMKLQGYLEMLCYDSETTAGGAGCLTPGQQVIEVKMGAIDVPLDWVSPDLRGDLDVWFAMQTAPDVRPRGLGGALVMTGGELDFQGFVVQGFAASVAAGADECYLAATARVLVSDYEASGGIFFGRACTPAPLRMVDPDAGSLLGNTSFTGAYVYGEAWIPISEAILGIPASCLFRISAGVGAGAFFFAEGPTYGGRMRLGASGEALCVVSIRGDVGMTGVMTGGSLKFSGRGNLSGKAGYCPFCVRFSSSAKVTYQNGAWSVDF